MQLFGALLDEFQVLADIDRQKRQAEADADLDLILRARRRRCRAEHSGRRKPKHKSAQSFCSSFASRNYSAWAGWSEAKSGNDRAASPPSRIARSLSSGRPLRAGPAGSIRATAENIP